MSRPLLSRPWRSAVHITALLALVAPAPAAAEPPAASPTPLPAACGVAPGLDALAEARALFICGEKHLEKKEWQPAFEALDAAWARKRHWQVAMELGRAEIELGKVRAAAAHLSFAVQDPQDKQKKEKLLKEIGALLDTAKSRIAHVRVAAPAGAAVIIDGANVGTAPLRESLDMDPGSHVITAEVGSRRTSRSVTIPAPEPWDADEPLTVTIDGPPATEQRSGSVINTTASTSSEAQRAALQPNRGARPSVVPAVVLGAASVAALGVGVWLFITSEVKGSEAERARLAYDRLPAQHKTDDQKKVVGDLLRAQDAFITGSVATWIGAAALGAGAIGYAVYRHRAGQKTDISAQKAAVQWAPAVSPQGAGVVVQGSF